MTIQQQQQYYYMQRQRQNALNAYARQMMIAAAQEAGWGRGEPEEQKEPVYPNDKLRIVVETTSDSQLMSSGLFAASEEPGYTKTGIYSAKRDDAEKPIVIDWGDGTVEEVDGDVSQKVHEYAKVGQYMVVVENIKSYTASANNSTWYNTTSQNAYTLKRIASMPESVTSIVQQAFFRCYSLSSIQLPDSVTSIGDNAFDSCSSLSSITIPNGVTSIKFRAFAGCSSLSSIQLPDSVTSIGDAAFYGCSSFVCIQLPASLTSIGKELFSHCTSLVSISIPSSVTSINNFAFNSCSSLSSIQLPDSVISIGTYAFSSSSLSSIHIPKSVTSIGQGAFASGGNLTSITIDEDNPNYKSEDNMLLTKDGKTLVAGVNGDVAIVPDGVTSILGYAFDDCYSLASITIPSSVTSIGDNAFDSCSSLSSITIPNGVTSIGNWAFQKCSSISSITCNAMIAPTIKKNTFGNANSSYVGRNTYDQDINRLYIPIGATGYNVSYWVSTLQNPDKCGFTIEYI